ncbi:molybdopterin-dependent oxidoreductase [Shimia sp. NS0008-38b]|uniref:molybdopterin-dependent oxidoreductase n=1 Tax=Shimia sp. NS0008-38b TaxID=3127653 RepID=UPI003105A8A8
MMHFRGLVVAIAVCLPSFGAASDVLLSVSGDVASPPQGTTWALTSEDLRGMPATVFETETIWTEGPQVFEGVSLKALLKTVGASGGMLRATAANDYAVSIPVSDAVEGGPIIAYSRNGETMPLRDKGPLWIVYPYDDNEKYKTEEFYSRSIWQLNRLEVIGEE